MTCLLFLFSDMWFPPPCSESTESSTPLEAALQGCCSSDGGDSGRDGINCQRDSK